MVPVKSWSGILAACFVTSAVADSSQENRPPVVLPTVVAAAIPLYDGVGLVANVWGTVKVRVHTDGQKVALIVVDHSASPLLSELVRQNLATWRLAPHQPMGFDVNFRFRAIRKRNADPCGPRRNDPWIGPDPVSTLRLPAEIEVEALQQLFYGCDPTVTGFLPPISRISGTVFCDCEGDQPVAGASVVVRNSSGVDLHKTLTGADGKFSVRAARWGKNDLRIEKDGYFYRLYQVTFLPLPWYRPGNFSFEIKPDPVFGQSPRTQAFLTPTSVPIYPPVAREKNIDGSVRVWLEPDGHLVPVSGPAALLESTLEIARKWKLTKGDDGAEIHFKYTLIDGDCLGGGPIVKLVGLFDIQVTAKRIVPCGS